MWEKLHPRGNEDSPHQDIQELTVSLKNVKGMCLHEYMCECHKL